MSKIFYYDPSKHSYQPVYAQALNFNDDILNAEEIINKINQAGKVQSVNGKQGKVELVAKDIPMNQWTSLTVEDRLSQLDSNMATLNTGKADKTYVDTNLNKKVDKVSGKGLSTNDYTNSDKNEVAKIKNKAGKSELPKSLDDLYVSNNWEVPAGSVVEGLHTYKADQSELGVLQNLKTEDKTNLVNAINELVNIKQDRPTTYGVVIDNNNANPETRVQYIDNAVGFKPVRGNDGNTDWGSWKDTFIYESFKPCVVKNGVVQYYLNKDDFTKKEDGSSAVLTGADGDVMIEINKMWYKLDNHGDKQYVRISEKPQDGFKCLAHTRGDKEVDKIYVGAYLGYEQNGKLRSISGVEPTKARAIEEFRDLAEANGTNYHQVPFYALTLLQSIMTVMLKSTDTQSALGRGHVDDEDSFSKTGNTNRKGMMFGETGGQANSGQMCFMGIEDFWGNMRWFIDGCKYDRGSIKTSTTNFNNDAKGYSTVGSYRTGFGLIKSVIGTTEAGFIPDKRDGSYSTYYCDYGVVNDGMFPDFGGARSGGSDTGGFFLHASTIPRFFYIGSRLFLYGK